MDLHALTGLVAVVLSGSVVLVPVVALSVRFALKPLLLIRAAGHAAPEAAALQEARVAQLEAEIQHLHATVTQLAEAADFHRQLAASAQTPA